MQLNPKINLLPLIGLLVALGACQPAPQPLPTVEANPASPGEVEDESAEDENNNKNQQEDGDKEDDDEDDEKSEDKN